MANQLAFYFNSNLCTGCKACQIACKDKWDLQKGVTWRRVAEFAGGNWISHNDGTYTQNIFSYYVSVACGHCQNAVCTDVCPANAVTKLENGIVTIDQNSCIGCRYCEWACPYSAPQFDEARGVMTKCNFCNDDIEVGLQPACVAACPSRALDFGELDELRTKYGNVAEVAPLPEATITEPAMVMTPHRNAAPTGTSGGKLANPEEV